MKTEILPLVAVFALTVTTSSYGGKNPFPKQPKINGAYKELVVAGNQVNLSKKDVAGKHLIKASNNLAAAKANLEEAKKDKGSARPSAIKLIELAQTEIDAAKSDNSHLDKASEYIAQAIEKVNQAGENGR